jgi:hypothetical protein
MAASLPSPIPLEPTADVQPTYGKEMHCSCVLHVIRFILHSSSLSSTNIVMVVCLERMANSLVAVCRFATVFLAEP